MVKATYKQTFIGIWLHNNTLPLDQQDKMKLYLNRTFYYYRIFVVDEDFYTYIDEEQLVAKIFLIISTSDSSLDGLIQLTEQYPKIFEKVYDLSTKKLISVCFNTNNIDDLFRQMNKDIEDFIDKTKSSNGVKNEICTESRPVNMFPIDKPLPSLSVFNSKLKKPIPIQHMTKESLNFLCFRTMTDILCGISSYSSEELLEMWATFRDLYKGNQIQLDYIDELKENYRASEAITYYTGKSCLSRTVNQACHTENMKQIFTFRVYISDLHKQLVDYQEHKEQSDLKSWIERLYRGKPLSGSVLQQLIDNKDGLISMNGFLSTTAVDKVASQYHGDDQVSKINVGYKPVLFVLKINTTIKRPYAYIADCSTKKHEAEVLFSLGTIWRIKSVEINKDPCIVELTSCDELDSQLAELLKKYSENGCDLSSVGDILLELGDDDEAEWFYKKMLKQESLDNKSRGSLYYKIGKIRFDKKDYSVALENFKEAALLLPSSIDESDQIKPPRPLYAYNKQSPLIAIYNNMGFIYAGDSDFKKATNCYEQALKVENGSKLEKATVYYNLGRLYFRTGKYDQARNYYAEAIQLIDESHPCWAEFKRNLDSANQRCEHLKKKKQNDEICKEQLLAN